MKFILLWLSLHFSILALASSGEPQVLQMLQDRPAMAVYKTDSGQSKQLMASDSLFQAAAAIFADPSKVIVWSAQLPQKSCADADHVRGETQTTIRLNSLEACSEKPGQALNFGDLWSSFFFEVFNSQLDQSFLQIYQNAIQGKLTKAQWIEQNTRLEYAAELKRQTFYKNILGPWARKNKYAQRSEFVYLEIPGTYEEWIAEYQDPNSYPMDSWGKDYDQQILPYLKKLGLKAPL